MKQLFKHDCNKCKFLGTIKVPLEDYKKADFYTCGTRFALRYSDKPSDVSGLNREMLNQIWGN